MVALHCTILFLFSRNLKTYRDYAFLFLFTWISIGGSIFKEEKRDGGFITRVYNCWKAKAQKKGSPSKSSFLLGLDCMYHLLIHALDIISTNPIQHYCCLVSFNFHQHKWKSLWLIRSNYFGFWFNFYFIELSCMG